MTMPWVLTLLVSIFWTSVLQFAALLGVVLVAGALLGLLERQTNTRASQLFGMNAIYVTAWLGTPIHELGHVLLCVLFRHQITGVKWFQHPDEDGTLGYVSHRYNPESFYQKVGNLFIGIAPLLSGGLAIIAAAVLLLPPESRHSFRVLMTFHQFLSLVSPMSWMNWVNDFRAIMGNLLAPVNFTDPFYWLFLWCAICIASHMSLSRADVTGASSGAGLLFLFCLLSSMLSTVLDPALGRQIMRVIGCVNYELLLILAVAISFSFIKWIIISVLWNFHKWLR